MADLGAFYRVHLAETFQARKKHNPRYSLRGYAKSMGVDPGYLSKLLNGKILLSLDLADKLTLKLKLNKEKRAQFLISAAEEQQCHALYLIDPSLTDCEPAKDFSNRLPSGRKKLKRISKNH